MFNTTHKAKNTKLYLKLLWLLNVHKLVFVVALMSVYITTPGVTCRSKGHAIDRSALLHVRPAYHMNIVKNNPFKHLIQTVGIQN